MNEITGDKTLTNVKGYFNPNTWSVQVAISELNLTVTLEPMQFVLDRRTGKKINDPILNRFVGPKMLSPEITPNPVPVIMIPVIAAPVPARPGYVVGQGTKDAKGKWQMPTTAAPPPLPATSSSGQPIIASRPSIQAMTVEEARKMGLIGRARLVPDDFGASEVDGAPVEGAKIPRIKYAMESTPRLAAARPGALPKELSEGVQPVLAPIIKSMEAEASSDPDRVNLNRRAAEAAVQEQLGETGVAKFRQQVKAIARQNKPTVATIAKATPAAPPVVHRQVAQPVVPITVPKPAQLPSETDNPLMGGVAPEDLPAPQLEEAKGPITPQDRESMPIRCGACGKEFKYPSWYTRHVHDKHRDRIAELLPTDKS